MGFLQPALLAALPLVALPILIHLINQRRFQTLRWGAMMFLLAANRMSRGYAKLRQWLIMAFRMLAIAGLIVAVARPLASGWLGLTAGGKADTTIVILDRSPSMRQQGAGSVGSKLDTGRQQLARSLGMLSSSRWVLIENTANTAHEIESPEALLKLPTTEPASTSADLPAMLQAAHDYIKANKSGRAEIWICSDIRANDWHADSGRWKTLRDSFLEFSQGVRFHLLAYPQSAEGNIGVRVTDVRRRVVAENAELLVSLKLSREGGSSSAPKRERGGTDGVSKNDAKPTSADNPAFTQPVSLPITLEIEGARSEMTVEMVGATFDLKDHRIPLERGRTRGWGKVSIPADSNSADNDFYFVFDQSSLRHTAIVTDDPNSARPLQLAASISPDPNLRNGADVVATDQLASLEWDKLALLLWHAPLPESDTAKAVQEFVDRGGQVIFFAPPNPTTNEFLGVKWGEWQDKPDGVPVETWRGDQDILAHTQSGAALPVGSLQVRKFCDLSGETTPLAVLKGGALLLARVTTNRGGVYFCTTTPAASDSSLATDGVVLYVLTQRALAAGAGSLGNTKQLIAGDSVGERATDWQQLAGPPEALSTDYVHHGGVYGASEKLFALNRSLVEDQASVLADDRVAGLFQGLDFTRVNDQAGSLVSLIQEIWRLFLFCMIIALIVEAALCLPKIIANPTYSTSGGPTGFETKVAGEGQMENGPGTGATTRMDDLRKTKTEVAS